MIKAYCLPFASGSSLLFAPWSQQLDDAVEVVALELPGRGGRAEEKMAMNDADDASLLDGLCNQIMADLRGAQYVLVGFSMGGNLTMDIALRLAMMQAPSPLAVYIAGRKPPASDPATVPGITMSNEELAEYAFAPPEVARSLEFVEHVVPLLRADLELDARCERRLAKAALAGNRLAAGVGFEAYCGTSDTIAPWNEAQGWERFTRTNVGVHFFPGGHEFMSEHRPLLFASWRRDAINRLVQRRTAEVAALAAQGLSSPGVAWTPKPVVGVSSSHSKAPEKEKKLPLHTVRWVGVSSRVQSSPSTPVFPVSLAHALPDHLLEQALQAMRNGVGLFVQCSCGPGFFSEDGDSLDTEVRQCWQFLRLVQHLSAGGAEGRIIVACPSAASGAMVVGASKAVAMEASELKIQRVFVSADELYGSGSWLCGIADSHPHETDLWVKEGRAFAQRLEPMLEPSAKLPCLPRHGPDGDLAVYVLSGATGGLGSSVVEWMIHHQQLSPQQLVLLRRAGSSPLSGDLAKCRVVEVASPDDVDSLCESALKELENVTGLFHLAGVLDDGVISGMTEERVRKVAKPKCGIAVALLRVAAEFEWPVQWMLGFSSTSSLFGYAGQANYCAANSVLDNLATFGDADVLPMGDTPPCRIVAINWGPWGEAGMAKVGTKAHEQALREGDTPLSTDVALRCLAAALRTATQAQPAAVQFCACDVEWTKSQWSGLPILELVEEDNTDVADVPHPGLVPASVEMVAAKADPEKGEAHEETQRKALEKFIESWSSGKAFSKVQGKTLVQLGVDSLEMVQFRNAFNKRFSVTVPLGIVADPSQKIAKLADVLEKYIMA